jgi:hypothetical protein
MYNTFVTPLPKIKREVSRFFPKLIHTYKDKLLKIMLNT